MAGCVTFLCFLASSHWPADVAVLLPCVLPYHPTPPCCCVHPQVHQLKGERSFHIFYQLVRGASKDKALKEQLKLPNKPNDYVYLSKSGCTVRHCSALGIGVCGLGALYCICSLWWQHPALLAPLLGHWLLLFVVVCCAVQDIDGVDDAADFKEVLSALSDIGVQQDDISTLLHTLSGILWLGNLKIEPVHADDSSKIKADAALCNAAGLLGLTEEDLAYAITHKKVSRPVS